MNALASHVLRVTGPFCSPFCLFPTLFLPRHLRLNIPSEVLPGPTGCPWISQILTFLLFPTSFQFQGPGWPFPKLCLQFLDGPSVSNWRLLVLGIVSVIPCLWPDLCLCGLLFMVSPFTYYWVKNDQCVEKVLDQMMTLMKQVLSPSTCPYTNLFLIISDAAQPGDLLLQLRCLVTRWTGRQGAHLSLPQPQQEAPGIPAATSLQSCSSFRSSLWVEASAVRGSFLQWRLGTVPCGTSPPLLSTGTLFSAEHLSLSVRPSVPTAVSVGCLRGQCPVSESVPHRSHRSGSVTADHEVKKHIH